MRHDDPRAMNPLVRVTSLTCESGSNRIENFCTELLAWCLITSLHFRGKFLEALGIDPGATGFECHTQELYKTRIVNTGKDKGFFDCTIRTQHPRRLCVCEIKVWSGFGRNQIDRYQAELDKRTEYAPAERMLVTITPSIQGSLKHRQITWVQIEAWLRAAVSNKDSELLDFFADLLKHRGLGELKMKPITRDLQSGWNSFAQFQQNWIDLFSRLQGDARLGDLLGARLGEAKLQTDAQHDRSWIGFFSTRAEPRFYVGIGFDHGKPPALWIEVEMPTSKAQPLQRPKRMPVLLQRLWQNALPYARTVDPWINCNRTSKDSTIAAFLQPLTTELADNANAICDWYATTLIAVCSYLRLTRFEKCFIFPP
jgi:hypothetical protein